ncbi:MAG: AI-2E family transporter [Woeseiaceae bacterium]
MSIEDRFQPDEAVMRNSVNAFLRIGFLLLLIIYCLRIAGPFINLTLWAIIIAVALYPMHLKFAALLGNRPKLSATIIVLVGLALLLVPVSMLAESSIESVRNLSGELRSGELSIPPPTDKVAEWPLIGERVHQVWSGAAENLEATINQFRPQLVTLGEKMLKTVGGVAGGVLAFVASLIIAGFFLVSADACYSWTRQLTTRLAGDRGPPLNDLSIATIRSVAKGVLGVAIAQTLLAAVGLVLMDVPYTGIILAVILLVAVMQIPTVVVIAPLVIWVYSYADAGPATIFAVWMIIVSLSDNFLKPLLLGRGVAIPTLVILVGAIGGAITAGFIGLFLGAVILALFYELLNAWMYPESVAETLAELAEVEE